MVPERDAGIRAMNALRRLVSALRTAGAGGAAGPGLSVAQQFALRVVGRRPGLTMSDLAADTVTTASTVSEVVVRLVKRGLVRRVRDAADHRRVRLELTVEGAAVFDRLEQTVPERLAQELDSMDSRSREGLAESLEGWVDSAGLSAEVPRMFGEPRRRTARDRLSSSDRRKDSTQALAAGLLTAAAPDRDTFRDRRHTP